MRRSIAGVSSVAVHAVVVAMIAWCVSGRERPRAQRPATTAITVIATAPSIAPAPTMTMERSAGGGVGAVRTEPAPSPRRATAARRTMPAASATPAAAGPASDPDSATDPDPDSATDPDSDPEPGAARSSGAGGGSGTGNGTGTGDGTGTGAGRGAGRAASWTQSIVAAAPAIARHSLARPARLIWPTRSGSESQGTLYTVRVDVDDDGYVAGVRLLDASMSRRDQRAADAVWKFRYDPARDHAGRPIASTVDQPFILRR